MSIKIRAFRLVKPGTIDWAIIITPFSDPIKVMENDSDYSEVSLDYVRAAIAQKSTREEIAGAVARGWCHPKNQNKVMDADLAEAITDEVLKLSFNI